MKELSTSAVQGGMSLSAKMSEPDKLQECREWSGTSETVSKEGKINLQPVN